MNTRSELALQTAEPTVTPRRTWLPAFAQSQSLDVTRWQTRAAHGFSWHARGRAAPRRGTH